MDPITNRLDPLFGNFPEAVVYLYGGRAAYTNEAGSLLLKKCPADLLFALAEHPGGAMEIALEEEIYRVTVSLFDGGDLLVFRLLPPVAEEKHPFSSSVYRMRDCLTYLNAVRVKMQRELEKRELLEDFQQDLATYRKITSQILRLTRQAELTQEINDKTFPREEGFDLAQVCEGMAEEAGWLSDLMGVTFRYTSNVKYQAFQGSKSLLTQMLLALVSNAIRAAGKGGTVEMKFHTERNRVMISLRDTGLGIPEDRMSTLFSGEAPGPIPRPGEGAGLGLYNARRIAQLHGGLIIAESGREGGTSVVVSLPLAIPPSVPLRNNPGYDNLGGYSPVHIELSDILPWQAFVSQEKKL